MVKDRLRSFFVGIGMQMINLELKLYTYTYYTYITMKPIYTVQKNG